MTTPKRRKRSGWVWLAVIIGLIVVFYFARRATRTRIPVRTAQVVRSALRSTVPTNGKVQPQVKFEAHAPFPGLIKAVYVHQGQKVAAGTLLLTMDDSAARARMATALAALKSAQDAYTTMLAGGTQQQQIQMNGEINGARMAQEHAQQSLAALKSLYATGAASASEVTGAQQQLTADQAKLSLLEQRKAHAYSAGDLSRAKANLADAQAGYAAAQQAVAQATVRAPFAGTVYYIPVSPTEYVNQGDLLLDMADLSKLDVLAYFDEPEIGKLKVGQPVIVQWDAEPGKTWQGHILRVPSTIITYTTRNVGEVLVKLDDPNATLLPNTNVRVTALVADKPNALNVPREALHTENGQPYVYVVEGGTLHRTPVTVGSINLTQVQILSGLTLGQTVALGSTNGQPIGDGVAIQEVK